MPTATASLTRSLVASQSPTRAVSPSYETTDGPDCAELVGAGGLELLEWQRLLLDQWLARDETGHWASGTLGLSVPRQNGKSLGVGDPLIVYGEWIVYTAHLQKTASETFEALRDIFESPVLRPRVRDIKSAIGREEIILRNGGRIKFLARTRNGGRGQHGDLLVFDEAQALTSAQQASFLPVISASANPQTMYLGTPPSPEDDGRVFATIRNRALKGETERISWAEWSVERLEDAVRHESWYETNPSLGVLIREETVRTEFEVMDLDEFARERCGWWAPEKAKEQPALDPAEWGARSLSEAPKPDPSERVACGIKFSPDGAMYALSMAAARPGGPVFVECRDYRETAHGITDLAQWVYSRRDVLALVAIDGREWTPTIVQRLKDLGFPPKGLHVMRSGEVADACSMLNGAVRDETLGHISQPLVEQSVKTSTRRPIGRDGWGFGGSMAAPIESIALAHWAVKTTTRNPRRKLRVGV